MTENAPVQQDILKFVKQFPVHHVKAGDLVLQGRQQYDIVENEKATIGFIEKGMVKSYITLSVFKECHPQFQSSEFKGEEFFLIDVHGDLQNTWFGLQSLALKRQQKDNFFTYYAATECDFRLIPVQNFINSSHKDILYDLINQLVCVQRKFFSEHLIMRFSPKARVLFTLTYLHAVISNRSRDEVSDDIHIKQKEISQLAGLTRTKTNLIIKELEKKNLIKIYYNRIQLASLTKLDQAIVDEFKQ